MSIASTIVYLDTATLSLDPRNPRLREDQRGISQSDLLAVMRDWGLDEIASSIVDNHFWPNEALIIVSEPLSNDDTAPVDIVVEGNRRLAAVKLLLSARAGTPASPKWATLAARLSPSDVEALKTLPTIRADSRSDVAAFLGFRHVTGIKQWEPHEKAAFIATLIDSGLSYAEVMRRIGSKTATVRQHYIALKLFEQLEALDGVATEKVRDKFSVLFLSLRSTGTQGYLGIDIEAEPAKAKTPLSPEYHDHAVNFARWLFGDSTHAPLFTDSRHTDRFGRILASKEAVAYLERTDDPRFEVALRICGGDRAEAIRHLERAADEIEEVLAVAQHHSADIDVVEATKRLFSDTRALALQFPKYATAPAR